MICNEENTDGRATVTADEERVLHVDWTQPTDINEDENDDKYCSKFSSVIKQKKWKQYNAKVNISYYIKICLDFVKTWLTGIDSLTVNFD